MKWSPPSELSWFAAGVVATILISLVFRPRYIDLSFPTPHGEGWSSIEKTTQQWRDSKGVNWITYQEADFWDSASKQEIFDYFSGYLSTKGWKPWNDCSYSPENLFFHKEDFLFRGTDYYLYRKANGEEDYNYTSGHIVIAVVRNKTAPGYNVRIITENPSLLSALSRGVH